MSHETSITAARQAWMRIFTLSEWKNLEAVSSGQTAVLHEVIRKPQTGMVMLRGRMGGTGDAFNFGEASVTRCAVRLPNGIEGHAYVLGRNSDHAHRAALLDALMQDDKTRAQLEAAVVKPLQDSLSQARDLTARKAAATRVDFFTLVRGDD